MPLLTPELISVDYIGTDSPWSLHQDISTEADQSLIDSIARLGLLRPPIVKRQPEGFELICGARRLNALKRLEHRSSIACLLVQPEINQADLLVLVAEDQRLSGPLSPLEAARLIALYEDRGVEPDQAELGQVTSTTSTTQRKRLLALLQLEADIRVSVHLGRISAATGRRLASMTESERRFVHDLFLRLALNKNKQRRFLELMEIINAVEGCTIERFITEHFTPVTSTTVENAPQLSNALMQRLYELSHPHSESAAQEFSALIAEMKLPANCRVRPSPSFETDKVTLEMEFSNFTVFSNAWEEIKKNVETVRTTTFSGGDRGHPPKS